MASVIRITDHVTGVRTPWVPNDFQLKLWSALEAHRYVYATKPRQVGATTGVTLDDVLWTSVADASGHRVRTAIVVDTEEKTRERMQLAGDFCDQLGFKCQASVSRIVFGNGSEIVGMTAGGNRAGASTTFQRLHLSELPFWADGGETYGALMPALAPGGVCVIETTMDTRTPLARDLWRLPNAYHKLFFAVEEHHEYRANADRLTGEQEEWLRSEGFTIREAMAWWLWAMDNLCGGDVVRTMREFPQREEHMFQAAQGRWVRVTPAVIEPIDRLSVAGVDGETHRLLIYCKPADTSGDLLIGVDTAAGKDRDRSIVVVVDKATRRMVACFASSTVYADDLARVAHAAQAHYSRERPYSDKMVRPLCLIEQGGVGDVACQMADRLGLAYDRVTTTEDSRYKGLLEAKRAVETGVLVGPPELAEECDELHVDQHGKFKGHKDMLMAYGFCALRMKMSPHVEPVAPIESERKIDGLRIIRQLQRQQRQRWY